MQLVFHIKGPLVAEKIQICGGGDNEKFISIDIIAKDLVTTRDSANSRTLVMKLVVKKTKQDKGTSMLFLGDLENEGSGTPVNSVYGRLSSLGKTVLKSDVIMLPHHGSGTNGNGDNVAFYRLVEAEHGIISSHITYTHQHPRVTALNSFCYYSVATCIIGCGIKWNKMCARGTTAWAANDQGFLMPHQTYGCTGKQLYQTTRFGGEIGKTIVLEAHLIITYLYPKEKEVRIDTKKLDQKVVKGLTRFTVPLGGKLFEF